MTVKEFKDLILDRLPEEANECEITVPVNGINFDILGIGDHGYYTKPGGLPYEIIIG